MEKQMKQVDSLYRQIKNTYSAIKEAELQKEKVEQRRINLQELVENRSEISQMLQL